MAEYLYPGVYIEEVDTGNKPIEGVSTSTVGFLGITERGPLTPTFVTSYPDFVRAFGSYFKIDKDNQAYLAYAVEGFFQNGGLRCYVARVASGTAKTASVKLPEMEIAAAGPGTWGGQVGYVVEKAGLSDDNLFKLTLMYWTTPALAAAAVAAATANPKSSIPASTAAVVETFDNLSANSNSSTYYVGAVNGVSNLVSLAPITAARAANKALSLLDGTGGGQQGDNGGPLALSDFEGTDTDPANKTGLLGLASVDDISILCCPDEHFKLNAPAGAPPVGKDAIAQQLQIQCETLKDRFAILQSTVAEGKPSTVTPTRNSKYVAYYYPWLNVIDAKTGVLTLVPPGGHVAGIYARSDTQRGVHKDPANEQVVGIDSLQLPLDNQTQAVLNPIGVNALRYFKGRGNLVWGGRTTAADPDWKYISVRRLFIFVEKSIERGTQWVVFEPNDQPTWTRVVRSVGAFLNGMWRDGMLQGATKEQAYFVRCDRTTMTQADIDNGRLIVIVGIAPVKPAEFVIFRIGQWTGGSDVAEI